MVRYAILWLLREHPDYGYRLKTRFERHVGALWQLNVGQIYQTLKSLRSAGLVTELEAEGARDQRARRRYQTTPKGQRMLARWLRRPTGRPRPVRDETLVRLLELETGGIYALTRVTEQEKLHRKFLERLLDMKRRLTSRQTPTDLVRQLSLEAALLHTEAQLTWLGMCRREIEAKAPVADLSATATAVDTEVVPPSVAAWDADQMARSRAATHDAARTASR
jgi:DNA-binding PadR family transcriptional regulator